MFDEDESFDRSIESNKHLSIDQSVESNPWLKTAKVVILML